MKTPVYLDHFATTPLDPRVFEEMRPYFMECFGNPHSSQHRYGWEAQAAVDKARKQLAALIGASPRDIIFTSGASESNNLAINSVAELLAEPGDHLISAATEHKSVLHPLLKLQRKGLQLSLLPVDANGLIAPDQLRNSITAKTRLISIMFANNEIGVIQPIIEIGKIAREHGIIFHCDATQALGKLSFDVNRLPVDLLSFSAHKLYGPKGVGGLYIRRQGPLRQLPAQIEGGGQEAGLRSGTLNVPGIVGFGAACRIAGAEMSDEAVRLSQLRGHLAARLHAALPAIKFNADMAERLPNLLSVSFIGIDGESLVHSLKELAVSTGSACATVGNQPSHVLKAIGLEDKLAHATLRFGLGRFNTLEEIDFAADRLIDAVNRLG